jgi:hypothetical protein
MSDPANSFSLNQGATTLFNRRTTVRYEFDAESVTPRVRDDQGATSEVRLKNLSAGGLSFIADRRIEPHTLLSVEIRSKDELGSRRLVMRVRSAEALLPGAWMIGCEFGRPLSSFELLALI